MQKSNYFFCNGSKYLEGTVIVRQISTNAPSETIREIFAWRYPEKNHYLVIQDGQFGLGHLNRQVYNEKQFFDKIIRLESPTSSDLMKLKTLKKDFALQNGGTVDKGLLYVVLIAVSIAVFPPAALILWLVMLFRKK